MSNKINLTDSLDKIYNRILYNQRTKNKLNLKPAPDNIIEQLSWHSAVSTKLDFLQELWDRMEDKIAAQAECIVKQNNVISQLKEQICQMSKSDQDKPSP